MQRFIVPTSIVCAGFAAYDFTTPKINILRTFKNEYYGKNIYNGYDNNYLYLYLIRYKYMGNYYKCFTFEDFKSLNIHFNNYHRTTLNYKKITKVELNVGGHVYNLNYEKGSELSEWLGYHQDFHNLYSVRFRHCGLLKQIIYSLQMDERDGIYQGDIGDLDKAYIDVYYDDNSIYRLDNNGYDVIQ